MPDGRALSLINADPLDFAQSRNFSVPRVLQLEELAGDPKVRGMDQSESVDLRCATISPQ
jgi:hypothetical protein